MGNPVFCIFILSGHPVFGRKAFSLVYKPLFVDKLQEAGGVPKLSPQLLAQDHHLPAAVVTAGPPLFTAQLSSYDSFLTTNSSTWGKGKVYTKTFFVTFFKDKHNIDINRYSRKNKLRGERERERKIERKKERERERRERYIYYIS